MLLPRINLPANPAAKSIIEFLGYNAMEVNSDGEMREMENLSSDKYPRLSPRPMRKKIQPHIVESLISRMGVLAAIRNIDGVYHFYYDNMERGNEILALNNSTPKHMVSINNKIVIFPDKVWYDIKTQATGAIVVAYQTPSTNAPTITYGKFLNTADATNVYDFIRIENTLAHADFKAAIQNLKDLNTFRVEFSSTINFEAKCDKVLYWEDSTKAYAELRFAPSTFTQFILDLPALPTGNVRQLLSTDSTKSMYHAYVKIDRRCPDLDFVIEKNNRLWGCCAADQTIYACRLGDPETWFQYQALADDSYAVSVASDGEFTGIGKTSTHICLFKDGCIHRVWGTLPSNFQLDTMEAYSVQEGSWDSVAVVNDVAFYKSHLGIMAYDGYKPVLISTNFGNHIYRNAVGGTDGIKYYVSMQDEKDVWHLFAFDIQKKLWHREDNTRVKQFCFHGNEMLFASSDGIMTMHEAGDIPFNWLAVFGDFYERIENKKIYSKFLMRCTMEAGSSLAVYMMYDGGEWQPTYYKSFKSDSVIQIPIIPRRCDKLRIKIVGEGMGVIETFVREYTVGSVR